MKLVLIIVMALSLAALLGCRQPVRGASQLVLRFERVVQDPNGEERFLLTLSNGLPSPVRFYELSADRMACAVQIQQEGQWTNVDSLSCCTTEWDTMLLKTGDSHQMRILAYPLHKPWRVGMQYWKVSTDGSIDKESPCEIWTDALAPINPQ